MLHILNKSAHESAQLSRCLELASDGDCLLFIENGVYTVSENTRIDNIINNAHITLCVLEADIEARGLTKNKLPDSVQLVNYTGFVKLVSEHAVIQS